MPAVQRVLTRKTDPATHRLDTTSLQALRKGEVLLAVRRVALTTNNITYALFGERMHYWQFFPSGLADDGIVPVWGFADVAQSNADGLAAGERVYGFLPLASHLVVQADRVSAGRFVDAAPHRAGLPAIYNQYLRCAADPGYRIEDENATMIARPLFTTAFLLADFLHEQGCFGAGQVVLSSASSKTAYATAWCLRELQPGVRRVGLTSARHLAFVQSLGCYDAVLAYDALATLDAAMPCVYADFAGSADLRAQLHTRFGERLRHSAVIGATQFGAPGSHEAALPGARPTFFFAPEQARRRAEAWGGSELQRRVDAGQRAFLRHALDPAAAWLRIDEHHGLAAAIDVLHALARGEGDPRLGHAVVID